MLNDTQLPILLTYPSFFQQRLVDFQILALIDVKYNFFQAPGTLHKRFYCLHSNGGGFSGGKSNSPVEIQQKARLRKPFSSASARQAW